MRARWENNCCNEEKVLPIFDPAYAYEEGYYVDADMKTIEP